MSFIVQRIDGTKVYVREYKGSTLRIGRGTDAQLRSESASVELEHALILAVEDGFEISDRGSITGTYVNGRAIQTAVLHRGDHVEIGDLQIAVEAVEPGQKVLLRVQKLAGGDVDVEDEKVPLGVVTIPRLVLGAPLKAPKVDYVGSYSLAQGPLSKQALAWLAVCVALATLLLIALSRQTVVFRPGELTPAHAAAAFEGKRLIGDNDCSVCHAPFRTASATRCQECHQRVGHQEGLATLGPCTTCHSEHRPIPNVEQVWQAVCIDCHKDLSTQAEPGKTIRVAKKITKFEEQNHPELLVTVQDGDRLVKLSPAEAAGLAADLNAMKFNHQGHLTGKFSERPPGPGETEKVKEKLTCVSCHNLDGDGGLMDARSYDKYCARCHQLTFDNRFPPVPHHLNLATVAGFIANAYSGNQSLLRLNASEVTRVLSGGRDTPPPATASDAVVRNAQQTIKTRCLHCHEFTPSGDAVIPARRQSRWFPGAKPFNHISHLNPGVKAKCIDCHATVLQSTKASDVNMPSMKACVGCHRAAGPYQVRSIDTCETCHAYHARTARLGKGWSLGATVVPQALRLAASARNEPAPGSPAAAKAGPRRGLPLWATATLPSGVALLSLVVALAVGAMRRRVVPAPPAPPPAALPKALTLPSPAAPPAPPPMPLKPRNRPGLDVLLPEIPRELPDRTIVLDLPAVYIVFLEGSLAGQRLPIDPVKGVYIGRDRAVADIVVGLANLSRRHVWIGALEGKIVAIDQNSLNGTYLGSSKTRITQAELHPGDVITLGQNDVRFRYEA